MRCFSVCPGKPWIRRFGAHSTGSAGRGNGLDGYLFAGREHLAASDQDARVDATAFLVTAVSVLLVNARGGRAGRLLAVCWLSYLYHRYAGSSKPDRVPVERGVPSIAK